MSDMEARTETEKKQGTWHGDGPGASDAAGSAPHGPGSAAWHGTGAPASGQASASEQTSASEQALASEQAFASGSEADGSRKSRSRYHHGDLANALTQAAITLAREGGPSAVVLREAARRVGVSPAAAYRHFATHNDLLYEVKLYAQRALAEAMEDGLERAPAIADPADEALRRMIAIGRRYLDFALDEPGLFRTAFCRAEPSAANAEPEAGEAGEGPDHSRPHTVEYLLRYRAFKILSDTLDTLVDLGLLAPHRRANAEVPTWAAVHGLAMLLLDGPLGLESPEAREAVLIQTVDTMINGLVR